ncbi:MAG: NADH-quinone oxidoreductase subunit J [Candidatus Bathyarchaeia archaeon]|nr:NADH-quinone oxidoreductase subunit J [Candidatus Bathyarchaeota archaeon]
MNAGIIDYLLIILAIAFSILATQYKELNRAIGFFAVTNVIISIIFYILGAPYIAVFQLLVYAGAVTVLFLTALHTLGGEANEK